jgi:hypothetical protein
VVVLPSFRSEWALRLHGAERFGYAISVSQVDKPLWENKSADVSQSEHRLDVTRDFADALTGVVTRALLTVSNTNRPRIGVDGVTYHFLAQHPEFHRICGQTWSPAPSTMAGKLVDLIERLRRRVQGDSSAECSIDAIAAELQRFEVLPPYCPNDKQIEAVAKDTSRSVELYAGRHLRRGTDVQPLPRLGESRLSQPRQCDTTVGENTSRDSNTTAKVN